jgi:hypothetical protein
MKQSSGLHKFIVVAPLSYHILKPIQIFAPFGYRKVTQRPPYFGNSQEDGGLSWKHQHGQQGMTTTTTLVTTSEDEVQMAEYNLDLGKWVCPRRPQRTEDQESLETAPMGRSAANSGVNAIF